MRKEKRGQFQGSKQDFLIFFLLCACSGPQFGSSDLIIGPPQAAVMGGFAGPDMEDTSINAGNLKTGSSSFLSAYENINGWPRGNHRFVEVEIYCNGNIAPTSNSGGGFKIWPF